MKLEVLTLELLGLLAAPPDHGGRWRETCRAQAGLIHMCPDSADGGLVGSSAPEAGEARDSAQSLPFLPPLLRLGATPLLERGPVRL